jgi:hypothetical protein
MSATPQASHIREPEDRASAVGRGCVKTRPTRNFRGHRTLPAMPIVDPGPIWKVDFGSDHAKTGFSHSLGRQRPFAASGSSRWPGLVAESLTHACVPPPPNVKFRGTADSRPRGWPTSGIGSRRHSPATFDRPLPVSSSPLADCPERPLAPKAVRCGPCTRAQPADPERYRQQMLRSHAAGLTPRSSE